MKPSEVSPAPLEGTGQGTEGQIMEFGVGRKWRRVSKQDEPLLVHGLGWGALGE